MVLKEYWELQLDKACSSEGKEHSDSGFIQEGEPREFSGRKMWILKEKQHWGWLKYVCLEKGEGWNYQWRWKGKVGG